MWTNHEEGDKMTEQETPRKQRVTRKNGQTMLVALETMEGTRLGITVNKILTRLGTIGRPHLYAVLNEMIENGLVEKENSVYGMTDKGKRVLELLRQLIKTEGLSL
jgi:predicted transcriptional regulator